jgi:hypothetical protein
MIKTNALSSHPARLRLLLITDVRQSNEISIVSAISLERNIKGFSPYVRNIS